jgi:tetratricopeptide (TPR) repeat protein
MRRILNYILFLVLLTSCNDTNEELFDKAYNLGKEKKYDKAIEMYTKLIRRNRRLQLPYYNRGLMYLNMEKYDKALKDFDEVLSLQNYGSGFMIILNPDSPIASEEDRNQVPYTDVLYQKAQVEYSMDSLRSSFRDFKVLVNNNYEEKSNCLLWLGTIMIRYDKTEKACGYFNSAKQAALTNDDRAEADKMINLNCGNKVN